MPERRHSALTRRSPLRMTSMQERGSESAEDMARHGAFMSALVTEHFVLQSGADAATSEMGSRAALYLSVLGSALVAMGFAAQSRVVFVPFVATVLPAVFVLGLFTVVRLVDALVEYNRFLAGIARVREQYH